ncbi:alpha/beta hydrolase [Spirosoma sp. SC4-14]|uniref:alpha/beta hydrolase n=1 Tax=Spirosoma sp. SC4-14 TaxID=3128900 RepID=UPI0030CDEAAA
MKRIFTISGLLLTAIAAGYMLGPSAHYDAIKNQPVVLDSDLVKLEQNIADSEKKAHLRSDNEARIVWADSLHKVKTPYSLVYIPGFSATWAEGDPIHKQLARHFGCNLYLARTYGHGVDSPDALKDLTPDNYARSAERALAIGKELGNKVIVIGTSAGGMLALYLAERHPDIDGLLLYSPCIAVANPALKLVTKPWGRQILAQVFQGDYVVNSYKQPGRDRYWLPQYHINGLIALQTMLDQYMTAEQFQKVKQPVFMGYYYKDNDHQDKVVSVAAMLDMFNNLGTAVDKKQKMAFPDAKEHVITSYFTSGDLEGVYTATEKFMEDVLQIPVAPTQMPVVALHQNNGSTKK